MPAAGCQILRDDPLPCPVRNIMRFRLLYSGNLLRPASQSDPRAWEKHSLRLHFHSQLMRLWETNLALKAYAYKYYDEGFEHVPFLTRLADNYSRGGIGFIPLITSANGLVCELDILFLRPSLPGQLVGHGGDIDNRIKTLLDSLRIPDSKDQMKKKDSDAPDPNPMYCLLQDDSLITTLKVTTDTMLSGYGNPERDVNLVITVDTAQVDPYGSPWEVHL
jgi:hypothetical protein